MQEIYLDNSATTRVSAEAAEAAISAMLLDYANPSSLHRLGMAAEARVKAARAAIAATLAVAPEEIFFTSGGTESDNLAICGIAEAHKKSGRHLITTAIEHPAVLETFKKLANQGFEVTFLPVDSSGCLRIEDLGAALRPDTILVSVMHVNNETGAIQPIAAIGEMLAAADHKIYFHVDGVQSYGKLPINPQRWGVDLFTASGHKIHAPKGVGLLYVRAKVRLQPQVCGGGQEQGLRSGTENVPAIAAFGVAAERAYQALSENLVRVATVRAKFLAELADLPDWQILGSECGLPYVLNIAFGGCKSEVLLHYFEEQGLYVSSGSACAARSGSKSHVLTAMGVADKLIDGAIRFSFCPQNSELEAVLAAEIVKQAVGELRQILGGMR